MGGFKSSYKAYMLLSIILLFIAVLTGFASVNAQDSVIPQDEEVQSVYGMYVNGREVGSVKYAARGLTLYDTAVQELLEEYEEDVFLEGEVYFREKPGGIFDVDGDEDLRAAIRQSIDVYIDAYAIVIDGETACHVKTASEADAVIAAIQKPFIDTIESQENHELQDVALQENIAIETRRVLYGQMIGVDQAVRLITEGEEGPREYTVKKGDSLWSIARAHDIRVADLEAANPDLNGDILQIGQKLIIKAVESLVTVATKEKFVYTEPIPFDFETREDSSLYKGETKIVQQGRDGEKEIEVLISKENGRETGREKIGETVVREPVPQITAKGTKSRPAPTVNTSTGTKYTRPSDLSPSSRKGVEMTPWPEAGNIFTKGSIAKVTHLDTGLVFYVYRRGGYNHADVEPLTAADTQVMRKIYGSFSWDRKSIIVEINGKKMAASMNGMPHGNYAITGNNFNGHFCIHFYKSRTHGTNRVDSAHQAAIKRVMD